jgi:predicted HTH domain antitoxin
MKTKLEDIVLHLFQEGKVSVEEAVTLQVAVTCLSYEIENKGTQSNRLLEQYGTQIKDGIASLNKYQK